MDLDAFPGGDLVAQGLADLARGVESPNALLVLIGGPRLRGLGFVVPEPPPGSAPAEHRLYELLCLENPDNAHGRYNALIRRLVSFERSVPCAG